ncbi:MAG TPA: tetratricopeptide repeat protein [Acidobacteriaceae bacterium]|nr:tetratricopeptide repeat protein [Acidobacteriaceae bacterium]
MKRLSGKLAWVLLLPLPCFVSLSLHAQTGGAPTSAGMERQFEAAMAAENRGDLNRAEALLSALHDAHPGIFAVDESLGLVRVSRGDLSRALPLLEAGVREQPDSDAAHANLGAVLYQLHYNQRAIAEFEQSVRINPRNFSSQQSLGRLWMDGKRPDEAATAFLAALHLKPDDLGAKLDCVTALLAANRVGEAQEMLATFPGADRSARAQSLLGAIDEKQGRFQSAGEHLALAAQLDPSEENAWQLGVELLRHWTFSAAVTEFQAASAKFPESRRMRLGLGAALFGDAQYTQAIPVFADLLRGEPDNAMYAELLGISCNAPMQTVGPGCAVLVTYAQSHPADAAAATYAASLLITQEENEQTMDLARKLLEQAITADSRLPDAQLQMGIILQDKLDWRGSIPYLERAVKLKPDLAPAHYRLARAYFKVGRKQDAQAQMELHEKFAHADEADLDRRLREVTRFVVDVH